MLELQHPIASILGITFKDLFPGYFVLVFLTYVFNGVRFQGCSVIVISPESFCSHENTALSIPGVRLFLIC